MDSIAPQPQTQPLLGGGTFGIMSAEKPLYPSLAPHGHEALGKILKRHGLQFQETHGRYQEPERAYIIHGIQPDFLRYLGKLFGQESVVHSQDGQHRLIYTNGPHEGKYHPQDVQNPVEMFQDHPDDYYTHVPGQGYARINFDWNRLHPLVETGVRKDEYTIEEAVAILRKHFAHAKFQPHPHAYSWHDGHTDHHLEVNDPLGKADPVHPHMSQPEPPVAPKNFENEQAMAPGGATYHQFAAPYGQVTPAQQTNLRHYRYEGKLPQIEDLVKRHGYQTYYAGGRYGKPDLARKNYNTGHLMVYDPTPGSGGDFKDEEYNRGWRQIHELSHALTYPELNKIYGEGRRIGKLGTHRNLREALRAVHWEWLAAHKQRELSNQLGVPMSDEDFHRELNTVMHDAAHRAVTGQFTEPGGEGFTPHSHKIPLATALDMVRDHAVRLGLKGMEDTLKKPLLRSEQNTILKSNEETAVADEKTFSPEEVRNILLGFTQERIAKMEQSLVDLRQRELKKAVPPQSRTPGQTAVSSGIDDIPPGALEAAGRKSELEKVTPPGREEQVRKLKQKPGIDNPWAVAWSSYNKDKKKAEYSSEEYHKDEVSVSVSESSGESPEIRVRTKKTAQTDTHTGQMQAEAISLAEKEPRDRKAYLKSIAHSVRTHYATGAGPKRLQSQHSITPREFHEILSGTHTQKAEAGPSPHESMGAETGSGTLAASEKSVGEPMKKNITGPASPITSTAASLEPGGATGPFLAMADKGPSSPEEHKLRIARQTGKMPKEMVGVMGGPSKEQAARTIAEDKAKRAKEAKKTELQGWKGHDKHNEVDKEGVLPKDAEPRLYQRDTATGSGGKIIDNRKNVGKTEPKAEKPNMPRDYTAAGVINARGAQKAEPPMAKPPSGKNPATNISASKPAAPKAGGMPAGGGGIKTGGMRMPGLRVNTGGVNIGGPMAMKSEAEMKKFIGGMSGSSGVSSPRLFSRPNKPFRQGVGPMQPTATQPAPAPGAVQKGDFGLDPTGRPATLPPREAPAQRPTRPASEFKLPPKQTYTTPPALQRKPPVQKALAAGAGGGAAPSAQTGMRPAGQVSQSSRQILKHGEMPAHKPGIFGRMKDRHLAQPPEDLSHLNAPPPANAPRITSRARAVGAIPAVQSPVKAP